MPDKKEESQQLIDSIQSKLDILYPVRETIDQLMRTQYLRLYGVTDGFRVLTDKKILDIGCGAREKADDISVERRTRNTMYEPWFARFAEACGAKVIGIDRRQSTGERYTHLQANILDPNTLAQFPDESFDIVNSSAFLVPPSRQKKDALGIEVTAPELLSQFAAEELEAFDKQLTLQVTRVLKEEGYFFYNESIYQKQKGQLCPIDRTSLYAKGGLPIFPSREST